MADSTSYSLDRNSSIQSPRNEVCHFFRLPLEIRQHVYRYALLTPETCKIGGSPPSIPIHKYYTPVNPPFRDASDTCPATSAELQYHGPHSHRRKKIVRGMSILGLCRSIHTDAIQIFCAELTVVVYPSDVECLTPGFESAFLPRKQEIWRHDPLLGPPSKDSNGVYVYPASVELGGKLEPHIFARFRNILFMAHFQMGRDMDSVLEEIKVYHDLRINEEDVECLTDMLDGPDFLETLSRILRSSERVNLVVELGLCVDRYVLYWDDCDEIGVRSQTFDGDAWGEIGDTVIKDGGNGDRDGHDHSILDLYELDRGDMDYENALRVVRRRAVELFVDIRGMDCLKKARTIESFDFELSGEMELGLGFPLKGKYAEIIRELKEGIEASFREGEVV